VAAAVVESDLVVQRQLPELIQRLTRSRCPVDTDAVFETQSYLAELRSRSAWSRCHYSPPSVKRSIPACCTGSCGLMA